MNYMAESSSHDPDLAVTIARSIRTKEIDDRRRLQLQHPALRASSSDAQCTNSSSAQQSTSFSSAQCASVSCAGAQDHCTPQRQCGAEHVKDTRSIEGRIASLQVRRRTTDCTVMAAPPPPSRNIRRSPKKLNEDPTEVLPHVITKKLKSPEGVARLPDAAAATSCSKDIKRDCSKRVSVFNNK